MIYADFNGSAPLCKDVCDYLVNRLPNGPYSNPNAIHSLGKKMMFGMEKCRRNLGKILGCQTDQIIFNSGSSEGITQIFYSLFNNGPQENKNIIITSGIEHSVVAQCCELYSQKGYEVKTIKTNKSGMVDIEDLKSLMLKHKEKVALVTVMAANNENGIIQPFNEVGKITKDAGVLFLSDTTQFIGKTDFKFNETNMDFAVMSSHKVGALIGSGLIIAKDPTLLKPLIMGGGQEKGLRGGTQNYIGIETMAVAMDSFNKNIARLKNVESLRLKFEKNIRENFPETVIIGENSPRLASTTMIAFPGIHGQAVQIELESQDIFVTTSSACSDNQPETSRVLHSMGIKDDIGRGVVRISLCTNATEELYDKIEVALTNAYNKLKKLQSF
jgi:cysteine desulfurase